MLDWIMQEQQSTRSQLSLSLSLSRALARVCHWLEPSVRIVTAHCWLAEEGLLVLRSYFVVGNASKWGWGGGGSLVPPSPYAPRSSLACVCIQYVRYHANTVPDELLKLNSKGISQYSVVSSACFCLSAWSEGHCCSSS